MKSLIETTWGLLRILAAGMFFATGVGHFVALSQFARFVPPLLPAPRALVVVSGVAEITGAVGLLIPTLRRWAGYGLIALLVAVFPANIYMAVRSERFADIAPAWGLWLRLPMQFVLIAWVWWISRTRASRVPSAAGLRSNG